MLEYDNLVVYLLLGRHFLKVPLPRIVSMTAWLNSLTHTSTIIHSSPNNILYIIRFHLFLTDCRPNKLSPSDVIDDDVGSSQRTTRNAENLVLSSTSQDDGNVGDDDTLNPTQVSVAENGASSPKGKDVKPKDHDHEGKSYLIYVSAVPTVLIFIICVIIIAIKNRFESK